MGARRRRNKGYYSSVEVSATLSTPWRGLAKLGARGSSTRFIFKPANEEQLAEKGDDGREIVSEKLKVSFKAMCATRKGTHPKRLRKPNISINTPVMGHRRKTKRIPPRKHAIPRSLSLSAKSRTSFAGRG